MAVVYAGQTKNGAKQKAAEPAWDVALLFPRQGEWTEDDYFALENRTRRMIELSDGCLEVLPTPVPFHQRIAKYLFRLLDDFVIAHQLGEVFFAPLPVKLFPGTIREPDIAFFRLGGIEDPHHAPVGTDLAIEVVSPEEEDRERDLVTKRAEYAQAKIPEYWIVDPQEERITVLTLKRNKYKVHGEFGPGARASSVLLRGFEVDVEAVFAAGKNVRQT